MAHKVQVVCQCEVNRKPMTTCSTCGIMGKQTTCIIHRDGLVHWTPSPPGLRSVIWVEICFSISLFLHLLSARIIPLRLHVSACPCTMHIYTCMYIFGACTQVHVTIYLHVMYMLTQSTRQGKLKQLYPKTTLFFLPQAGFEPATFCILDVLFN